MISGQMAALQVKFLKNTQTLIKLMSDTFEKQPFVTRARVSKL